MYRTHTKYTDIEPWKSLETRIILHECTDHELVVAAVLPGFYTVCFHGCERHVSAHNIRNFAPSRELGAHFECLGLNSDSKNMVIMNMNLAYRTSF